MKSSEVECALPTCDEVFLKRTHNHLYCSKVCKRKAENGGVNRQIILNISDSPAINQDDDGDEDIKDFLRKENARLERLASKHKNVKDEAINTVYGVAKSVFTSFDLPKIAPPRKDARLKEEEVAVAVLSDFQLGKNTKTYNSDVCAQRIDLYGDEVVRITDIMRSDHPVRHLRCWMLGDIVEGEDIYPGQTNEIDSSLYKQVGVNGPAILYKFFTKMLQNFDSVHVVCVIGNHGTLTGGRKNTYNNETNMDRLLYKIMEWIFIDEPRITFEIPDGDGETSFYAIDSIGEYSTLLLHGNQFPNPTSTHGYFKKVMGWKDGAIPEKFNDVIAGHWHHNVKMTLGSTTLRIVGSPESYNTFAQELLGAMSPPSQHLQFVNPRTGVTSEHTVLLDKV